MSSKKGANVPAWHPIDFAFRTGEDELLLVDPYRGYFGVIRRLRFGGETWYRGVTWAEQSYARQLVGYSRDCRAIAKALYVTHLATGKRKQRSSVEA